MSYDDIRFSHWDEPDDEPDEFYEGEFDDAGKFGIVEEKMKTSIAIPAKTNGYPCIHCKRCDAQLRFIEHDVTPEVEPCVEFVFVCNHCHGTSRVDMDDAGTFLGIVAYQINAY